jgi:hypothetical protein
MIPNTWTELLRHPMLLLHDILQSFRLEILDTRTICPDNALPNLRCQFNRRFHNMGDLSACDHVLGDPVHT